MILSHIQYYLPHFHTCQLQFEKNISSKLCSDLVAEYHLTPATPIQISLLPIYQANEKLIWDKLKHCYGSFGFNGSKIVLIEVSLLFTHMERGMPAFVWLLFCVGGFDQWSWPRAWLTFFKVLLYRVWTSLCSSFLWVKSRPPVLVRWVNLRRLVSVCHVRLRSYILSLPFRGRISSTPCVSQILLGFCGSIWYLFMCLVLRAWRVFLSRWLSALVRRSLKEPLKSRQQICLEGFAQEPSWEVEKDNFSEVTRVKNPGVVYWN